MNNKEKAIEFLQMVIQGNIDKAYQEFVDSEGKHHNIYFEAGFDALKEAMVENHIQFPNKNFEVILAISENDLVTVLTKVGIENKQYSISHFFKFNDGKIIEMWDNAQETPDSIINKDGAF
jgi:predicted SnoaL-like aldol condensation-catalyzing enzyme